MVGVPLHHYSPLLQVLSFVVNASYARRLVAQLRLHMICGKSVLIEDRACDMSEAVSGLSAFVSKTS
ncbi:hypothetical protein BV326_05839 [Pseudomonas syringae pv. actinidiae]|nr:hypothetical protein BV326_05839 [Pseudomonas syringae pv. actinidiae]